MTPERPSGRTIAALVALVAAAAALRLYRLGEGLWFDEIVTLVSYARQPFAAIVTTYDSQNQHLLYSLSAHLSFLAFGESAWALRFPATLFGVGGILALYAFARQVTSSAEALAAAALLTFSFHHIWFSQNARGYTALLFFTLLSSYFLVRGLADGRPRTWIMYAGCVAIGMYSHLTMLFVSIGQFAMFCWERLRDKNRTTRDVWLPLTAGFGLSAMLTLVLYAPVLGQLLGPGLAEETEAAIWLNPLWTLAEMVARLRIGLVFGAAGVFGGIVLVVGFWSYWRERPALHALFIGPCVAGAVVTIAMQHALWPRFFFFAAGFALLVVVRGIFVVTAGVAGWVSSNRLVGRRLAAAVATAAVAVSALGVPRVYGPKQDYESARAFVASAAAPGDVVATSGLASLVYQRYYGTEWRAVDTAAELRHAGPGTLWILYTMPTHLEGRYPDIARALRDDFEPVREFPGTLGDGTVFVRRSRTAALGDGTR
jgi:4-amino-4-deoxy-L-arabinose transferase-like glycosyltransferase